MPEFATVRRPDINELKFKYEHAREKKFYVKPGDEYKIDIILGDSTYCKIKTEKIVKGNPGEPIVEGTTIGWVIHGGDDHVTDQCMFMRLRKIVQSGRVGSARPRRERSTRCPKGVQG